MIDGVNASVATSVVASSDATSKDPKGGGSPPTTAPAQAAQTPDASVPVAQAKPTTRLLIDQDKLTGVYVYRIIDSVTGDLLAEIPSDQIDNLKNADNYVSGSVISTSA